MPLTLLSPAGIEAARRTLTGWSVEGQALQRTFTFSDYGATIAFVNAVARIAVEQDHHPVLVVGYDRCEVRWSTHTASGITEKDLSCAKLVDRLTG